MREEKRRREGERKDKDVEMMERREGEEGRRRKEEGNFGFQLGDQ